MTIESDAIESQVLRLMDNFRFSATDAQIDAYIDTLSRYTPSAVLKAVDRFVFSEIDRKHEFMPTAPEVAQQAKMFDDAERRESQEPTEKLVTYPIGGEPPPGHVPLGPIEVAFEGRRIDMRGMDHKTKEFVMAHKRLPEPGELGEKPQIGFTPRLQRA